jgi:hypothetical protein
MASILKRYITLPMNVIFTVHTTTTQDEESRLIYMPALQGGIKDEVAGYVDYSLLAFRERQTGTDGVARVNYYLKTEGDTKNPTIGNRSAGRIPEISKPDFKYLHEKHFGALKVRQVEARSQNEVIKEDTSEATEAAAPAPVPAAQSSSTPQRTIETPPKPTGVPEDDPNAPINASGLTMLTKAYTEQGLTVPEDLKSWNIGKARTVAKWFMAWKADMAAGVQTVTREDLIGGLEAFEAFAGELKGVQTGVQNLKSKKATEEPAVAEEPVEQAAPETPAQKAVTGDQTEEGAVELLQEQLGAKVIGYDITDDATCDTCGKPVDDPDIAKLGHTRFKKMLCVNDYKQAVKDAKK